MHQFEEQLNMAFTQKFPYQLPDSVRATIVKITPWLTLAGGVFSLIAVLGLYNAAVYVDRINSYVYMTYPYTYPAAATISPLIWVSLLIMLLEAIIFFIAFPGLRTRKKSGWNWLYWVSLLNVVYAVSYLFVGYNFGSLISSLLFSAVGLYFLFQIRSYYTVAGIPAIQPSGGSNAAKPNGTTEEKDTKKS
jgi:hypothetical protein